MPINVLVVDDSMLIRHTVCRFLEERGFRVESATNGVEALDLVSRVRPNLIITDMCMPKMSGSEFITTLRERADTLTIPIVILSGRQSEFHGSEQRASFVIYKDIDIDAQLEKALTLIFGKTDSGRPIAES
jgi:CheY-like chemotaxis protein